MLCASLFQGLERKHHHDDGGFHVQHSRPMYAAGSIDNAVWHGIQRAQRPHGVEVSQQQNWLAAFTSRKLRLEMISILALGMHRDFAPQPLKLLGQHFAQSVNRFFVVAGRFSLDQALQHRQHVRLMLLAKLHITGTGLGGWMVGHAVQ